MVAYNVRLDDNFRSSNLYFDKIDISASGDSASTVIAAVTGKRIIIVGGLIIATASITLNFEDGNGLDFTGAITLGTDAKGFGIAPDPDGQFITAAGQGFVVNYNGTAQVSGWLKWRVW